MRKLDIEEMVLIAGGCIKEPPATKSQSECNNGLGNGDQGAPGNSLYNNNAENSVAIGGGKGGFGIHPSGFPVKPNACGPVCPD